MNVGSNALVNLTSVVSGSLTDASLANNGDGQVAATEVRLLGVYNGTVLSLSDINLG